MHGGRSCNGCKSGLLDRIAYQNNPRIPPVVTIDRDKTLVVGRAWEGVQRGASPLTDHVAWIRGPEGRVGPRFCERHRSRYGERSLLWGVAPRAVTMH